ncbi:creatininase family protein [Paraliomyxa miuraensis]|uniref:creatininase family protein n=1 Tax=Paraliomyxa miuraensis TaxID=376150 RepID=UPI00224EC555|nr:creatininase family protein [Paraliomyxa miuraensis]MCX4243357.1 creatininase family protein [Paraliomyxa miuraensis]
MSEGTSTSEAREPGRAADLRALAYPEVEALLSEPRPSVAIIPTGSTEAHGPHLPLCTDTLISEEVAGRATRELAGLGWNAVRFPPLHYGVTDWAASFRGTTTISREVIHGLVLQACLQAHAMGFSRVAITNAHLEPGHIETLRAVTRAFEQHTGQPLLFADKTRRRNAQRLTAEFASGSCHAGQYETSLVLAIAPELVKMDVARALPEYVVPLHEKIAAGARDFVECGVERAYCGNPAGATAEEGEASLRVLTAMVVEAVEGSVG